MSNPASFSLRQRLKEALPDFPERDKVLTTEVLEGDMAEILGALRAQYDEVGRTRSKPKPFTIPMREIIESGQKKRALHTLFCHVEDLQKLLQFLKTEAIDHPQLNSMILQVVNTGDYEPLRDLVRGRAEGIKGRADHALQGEADKGMPLKEFFNRSQQARRLMNAWFDSASLEAGARGFS